MIPEHLTDELKKDNQFQKIDDVVVKEIMDLVNNELDNDQTLKEKIKNKLSKLKNVINQ